MITSYTLLSLSGSQTEFIKILSETVFDKNLKIGSSLINGTYIDKIIIALSDIILQGNKEDIKVSDVS